MLLLINTIFNYESLGRPPLLVKVKCCKHICFQNTKILVKANKHMIPFLKLRSCVFGLSVCFSNSY